MSEKPSIKDFANTLCIALWLGICDLSMLVQWADSVVDSEPHPSLWVIELSTAKSRNDADRAFKLVSGQGDTEWTIRMVIALIRRAWTTGEVSSEDAANLVGAIYYSARTQQLVGYMNEDLWIELTTPEVHYEMAQNMSEEYGLEHADVRQTFSGANETLTRMMHNHARYDEFLCSFGWPK
jgi:hypothetical protein